MRNRMTLLSVLLIAVATVTFGCSKSEEKKETAQKEAPAYKPATPAPVSTPPPGPTVRQGGIVREAVDADVYTYLNLEDAEKVRYWVAVPKMEVKAGDGVEIFGATPMPNFYSKTLDRTFDTILFANSAKVVGQAEMATAVKQLPSDHPPLPTVTAPVEKVEKVKGGYTVAELFSKRSELKGSEVKVRGKVVKYAAGIMGRNWLHLRDGTGGEGENDITVTTIQTSAVGEVVTATGRLETDRNLGGGYNYAVIIEDASITVKE